MKKITNLSKLLMVFGSLLATSCGTGSSSASDYLEQLDPVTINSLKDGLVHMNQKTNFTLDVYANNTLYYSIYYTDKYVGSDSEGSTYMNLFVNDGVGIFPVNCIGDTLKSGEYQLDANENKIKDLYDGSIYPVLYDVANSYIDDFDSATNECDITSKAWKLNFIMAIGFTNESYVNLDKLHAKYNTEEHNISFEATFERGKYRYVVVANKFGSTTNNHYRDFMKKGGKVYELSSEFAKFRELLQLDNFSRMTYDFDAQGYIGMEYFHPHYFYTKYFGVTSYSGYMSMNHKGNGADEPDLKGCYYFNVDDSGTPHFNSQAFNEDPDFPKFFHYPKYLELLHKLRYIQKGFSPDIKNYQKQTNKYMVYDYNLIVDFAKNFSLNQTWDFNSVPPYALGIEMDLSDTVIENNTIIFHYLMTYNREKYDYIIPISGFGKSDNPLLDKIYDTYND